MPGSMGKYLDAMNNTSHPAKVLVPIIPKYNRKCTSTVHVGHLDTVTSTVEAGRITYIAWGKCRVTRQRAVVAAHDVQDVAIPKPPVDHSGGRLDTLAEKPISVPLRQRLQRVDERLQSTTGRNDGASQNRFAGTTPAIRDRIKEFRRVKESELMVYPKNWRIHPKAQGDVFKGIKDDIGYADALIAYDPECPGLHMKR